MNQLPTSTTTMPMNSIAMITAVETMRIWPPSSWRTLRHLGMFMSTPW